MLPPWRFRITEPVRTMSSAVTAASSGSIVGTVRRVLSLDDGFVIWLRLVRWLTVIAPATRSFHRGARLLRSLGHVRSVVAAGTASVPVCAHRRLLGPCS